MTDRSNPTLMEPIAFCEEVQPERVGLRSSAVAEIARLFDEQITSGLHPGAQLVLLRHGRVVLDRAAGWTNTRRRIPVTPETPFITLSCSKPFTAMCIHMLVERGRLALDAAVSDYWPEFGCNGKGTATVRDVLLHRAGVPERGLYSQIRLWSDWERVTRNVAHLTAEYPPGTRTAYHTVNFGFILGEIVRRVSGLPMDRFLAEEYLHPLGFRNSWLGIPVEQLSRAARLYVKGNEQRGAAFLFNRARIRTAVVPAATLHSSARELAVFYQMLNNGGCYAGRRFLRADTVSEATVVRWEGLDGTIGSQVRWAMGFHLGGDFPKGPGKISAYGKGSTARTFGHNGQASCMTWADPDRGLVLAFTCNGLLDHRPVTDRWRSLSDSVWDAVVED